MVAIYNGNQTNFSKRIINNIIEALKIVIPVMQPPRANLIAFTNGVYHLASGQFAEHSPNHWLTHHNAVFFTPYRPGENLHEHAPHFQNWLTHVAGTNPKKAQRILAALYMVLANRYDWQLFLEITGEGSSGKSIFMHIATLLAGVHNSASGSMATLDTARGRAQFVNKCLITLPDQAKYMGEGTGIKAITGGDALEIDPKQEHQYSAILRAVIIATNNNPMIFTVRAGGVARRRVIFQFNHRIEEAQEDPQLTDKIAHEIPLILRHLLATFPNPEQARQQLIDQRDSSEALDIKRSTDPIVDMCAVLHFTTEPKGSMMGGGSCYVPRRPKTYLYHFYLDYLDYQGAGKPLSVERFARAVRSAEREYKKDYLTRKVMGKTQNNVKLSELAEEYLPQAYGANPFSEGG